MDGKGTLKEIYIASAYALTPIVLINVPMTIVSNYLTLNEDSFLLPDPRCQRDLVRVSAVFRDYGAARVRCGQDLTDIDH